MVAILGHVAAGEAVIAYRTSSPPLRFGAARLEEALRERSGSLSHRDLADLPPRVDVAVAASEADLAIFRVGDPEAALDPAVSKEGFQIARRGEGGGARLYILARDASGAMYGLLDLAEEIRLGRSLESVPEKIRNPRFPFRTVKFNLPWSPYRSGPAADLQLAVCRDLGFWRRFLDMLAENRFNVLSLWNLHPFPFLIRPKNFPEACPFSDRELEEWRRFWRSLFRMARERGLETYVINWNIVVSPEFARAHGLKERNDASELVRRYTRECVAQLIDEYEDLTGLGVTLADWMEGMTPREREDWIEATFIAGMKQARRQVKFIHRSVLAGSPVEMRRVIDAAALPDPVWVEVKFNWSHGHSTPRLAITHDHPTGQIDEGFWNPAPANYKIAWMVRN